ncbi:ABC-F family ATP-binding cassette domain-containing protein [Cellulomonas cellasea]|uniref:ABC-F family ATP-binding cassette domain-containing protein n=1 Tax=Cellulomonas cellasea TaxID=43670 RepID=UPI0025A43E66|nr:ABC-F family ATP-binding cassette domain-containing protein [Cellulomonas cellasea]MDM8083689.1 ABC-F family ATP-binding cassette domain-containing protein [Cellulomonas cellasea]
MTSAASPVHLVADAVSVGYPGRAVLDKVDVVASAGQRIGVVGENGAGKTTLLRVLAGDLPPSSGEVRRAGSLSVVDQELEFPPGATVGTLVAEALGRSRAAAERLQAEIEGFDHEHGDLAALADAIARVEHLAAWDADRRVDEALSRFGAPRDVDRPLDRLSVGERYRVRLACRIAERADILLLDEPTNHLDASGIDYLTAQLQQWPGVVVIVTHDRRLLDDVMTAILDLDPSMDGRPVLYGATSYAAYRFAKDQALRRWRARYRAERKRAEQLAERLDASYEGLSDEWRPLKGSQKNRRATRARIHVKAADRLVQRLEAQAVEVPTPPVELAFPDLPSLPRDYGGGPLLEVRAPRVAGDFGRARLDLPGVRVDLPPCGRLLVTGPNGSGKSTLLAALAGTITLDRGTRSLAPGARLGVLGQEGQPGTLAWAGEVPGGVEGPHGPRGSGFEAYARRALDLLAAGALDPEQLVPVAALGLLSEEDLERPLSELSVGQRRRFDLACALLAAPHVLILDEPTNHLSIGLVDELTEALRGTSAAVVVATHDRRMRADLADWPELALG